MPQNETINLSVKVHKDLLPEQLPLVTQYDDQKNVAIAFIPPKLPFATDMADEIAKRINTYNTLREALLFLEEPLLRLISETADELVSASSYVGECETQAKLSELLSVLKTIKKLK